MTAVLWLAVLGYVFAYLGYFTNKDIKGRPPIYEALTIVLVWTQLSVGWGIFLTVWSGFWFLVDLVRAAQKGT